jgi:aspartyl-tRNA(Asn)/glutamyl-tRNA(Gln) amidotransferase subunit B
MTVQPGSRKLLKGSTGDWEVVIGMEVHAQVTSQAKLFSGASTEFGGAPNSHVSLVDAAMPGMLPVINEECVRQAIRTGLGLKAKINLKSVFDRKNYFYPDLPQGYQISQYKSPVVGEGAVTVDLENGDSVTVGIERVHLEQDAGKSLHDRHPTYSYVDLNRSGVALMEIVSKPDLRSADEAKAYIAKVRSILRYLGTCDGDMEKGNLRADVNVSVRRPGDPLGTRCEIKNMNSISFIGDAIDFEARRQIEIIEDGGSIEQETRLYDPHRNETRAMRTKEEAHDYRYFPDPDLLPLELDDAYVKDLEKNLPELPDEKKERYLTKLGVSSYQASVLVAEKAIAEHFEKVVENGAPPKAAANWIINEYLGRLNNARLPIEAGPVSPTTNSAIVQMLSTQTINTASAKEVLTIVWDLGLDPLKRNNVDPRSIVQERGMVQVVDRSEIEDLVDRVLAEIQKNEKDSKNFETIKSNPNVLGWFVGRVMRESKGKASPQAVNDILKRKLGL